MSPSVLDTILHVTVGLFMICALLIFAFPKQIKDFVTTLWRFQWRRTCSKPEFLISCTSGLLLLIFSWLTYRGAQQTLKMSLRNELYSNERWWYDACIADARLYGWLVKPGDVPAEEYVRLCLQAVDKELSVIPSNAESLQHFLWDGGTFNEHREHKELLRRAYDLLNIVFYHMERIYSYSQDKGFFTFNPMDEEEADSWLGIMEDVGPHPLLLCSIQDAHEHGYISKEFAVWVQNTFRASKYAYVVEHFYPALLKDNWPDQIGEKHANLSYVRPQPASQWKAEMFDRKMKAESLWREKHRPKAPATPSGQ